MEREQKKSLRSSHVWLYVKNIEESVRFYEKVLGLDVAGRFPHGVLFRSGGVLIGIHEEEGDRRSKPGGMLIVLQTDDVRKTFEELKNKGVRFLTDQVQTEQFGSVADFKDPDGYLLEIWQQPQKPGMIPIGFRA